MEIHSLCTNPLKRKNPDTAVLTSRHNWATPCLHRGQSNTWHPQQSHFAKAIKNRDFLQDLSQNRVFAHSLTELLMKRSGRGDTTLCEDGGGLQPLCIIHTDRKDAWCDFMGTHVPLSPGVGRPRPCLVTGLSNHPNPVPPVFWGATHFGAAFLRDLCSLKS